MKKLTFLFLVLCSFSGNAEEYSKDNIDYSYKKYLKQATERKIKNNIMTIYNCHLKFKGEKPDEALLIHYGYKVPKKDNNGLMSREDLTYFQKSIYNKYENDKCFLLIANTGLYDITRSGSTSALFRIALDDADVFENYFTVNWESVWKTFQLMKKESKAMDSL